MTRVAVSDEVLNWALKRSDDPAVVAHKFPKLKEWRAGNSQPTLRQIEDFAKATFTPLGYFFLPKPPKDALSIPHFRTIDDQSMQRTSVNLLDTVHAMERRQDWLREYLIKQGQEPLSFVASTKIEAGPQKIAREIRQALHLDECWASKQPTWTAALEELRGRMEKAGIIVVVNGIVGNNTHRKLNIKEFRGFVLIDEYAPLVFVNGADSKAAQMFTLAHELAHVWLGKSAAFDLRDMQPADDKNELACNRVAAEFLVPESALRLAWTSLQKEREPFEAIAQQFRVSQLVAGRRALDVGLTSKQEFLKFYKHYQNIELRKSATTKGGNFYASQNQRIGRRFAETIIRAAREGSLLYRDAYHLTGLYGKTFEEYAGIVGERA